MTNRDKIRLMNNEELAEYLTDEKATGCHSCSLYKHDKNLCSNGITRCLCVTCVKGHIKWLEQEAE